MILKQGELTLVDIVEFASLDLLGDCLLAEILEPIRLHHHSRRDQLLNFAKQRSSSLLLASHPLSPLSQLLIFHHFLLWKL